VTRRLVVLATTVFAAGLGAAAAGSAGGPHSPVIHTGPDHLTAAPIARFIFTGKQPGLRFECALDDAAGAPCSSPAEYQVADGTHRFSVVAIDHRGRRSEPAYRAWVVDATAPVRPDFVEAPPPVTRSAWARFVVAASEQDTRTRCTLDGARVWCGADHTGLADGEHRFAASAVDRAGNRSAETEHVWRIDTVAPAAPEISAAPAGTVGPEPQTFAFTGETGAALECAFDRGPVLPCASPRTYPGSFTGGEHVFTVRARDAAGNRGAWATATWSVDVEPYRSAVAGHPALLGYWRLGEISWGPAFAAAGGPDGFYTGGVTLAAGGALDGSSDPSAEFDGSSGEVVVDGAGFQGDGTLEGWFDWTGVAALRDNTDANGWILGLNSGGWLACRVGATTVRTTKRIADLSAGWHHLAMTRSGRDVACYLDGAQSGPTATDTSGANPAPPWHVMNNGAVSLQYSRGRADEVAIYGAALTKDEITAHHDLGSGAR
jgi:hypothetical protein